MSQVRFDAGKGRIDRSSAGTEINPFDLNALEAAIQLKEKAGGEVTVISMGPPRAELALRDAIARGADKAVLLADDAFAGADTLATSYTLASAVRKLGAFDVVICGEKTVDGDTGQVGPELAEHLGTPHLAYVSRIEPDGTKLTVRAEMEGENYLVEAPYPVLLTVTKDINNPRLPNFHAKMNAKKAIVTVWGAKELTDAGDPDRFGGSGSPTWVQKIVFPNEEGRRGRVFRPEDGDGGATDEIVDVICRSLKISGEG